MRLLLVRLHRYCGLATALFLFVAGLTGALIAWDQELDAALNPSFYRANTRGPALPAWELARRIEAADTRLELTYLPLGVEAGKALQVRVAPRIDPRTARHYALDFNQMAVDPATGHVQARRMWGKVSLARLDLMPFLYELHYTLHAPVIRGFDAGTWLMGIVGIVLLFDCVFALVLSFPSVKSWRKSFAFRWQRGGYALTFDVHRSGGVWVWGILAVVAMTSVSMNLSEPVVRPLVSAITPLTPSPLQDPGWMRPGAPGHVPLTRERVTAMASDAARAHGITAPAGALYRVPDSDAYGVGFFAPGHERGDAGLGNAWFYYNASTGKLVGTSIPGEGTVGDVFMQAQFPLHSGRIAGLAGRIVVSAVGLAVATLSVTGVIIWIRKRNARRRGAAARG